MRVQTEEWRQFIPGVRMYKGKKTLFWNGEKLWDRDTREYLIYDDEEERESWEVIIVLPGVEIIPEKTFQYCTVETVIMSDTVRRIESHAFHWCTRLKIVRLSTNLEYIGVGAFWTCYSLTSIFIPPSCRQIDDNAFNGCTKLIIISVPQDTQLGRAVIKGTALIKASPFETDEYGYYELHAETDMNEWIRNRHANNQFSLHRACASYNPLEEVIFDIVLRQGIGAFKKPDSVGVTPSQYLSQNPFTEIEEQKIMKRYILDMMGELV